MCEPPPKSKSSSVVLTVVKLAGVSCRRRFRLQQEDSSLSWKTPSSSTLGRVISAWVSSKKVGLSHCVGFAAAAEFFSSNCSAAFEQWNSSLVLVHSNQIRREVVGVVNTGLPSRVRCRVWLESSSPLVVECCRPRSPLLDLTQAISCFRAAFMRNV